MAEKANREQFVRILRNHHAGETDFPTFCEETAQAGLYKWVIDLDTMTCSYLDLVDRSLSKPYVFLGEDCDEILG